MVVVCLRSSLLALDIVVVAKSVVRFSIENIKVLLNLRYFGRGHLMGGVKTQKRVY
jgi:hypothetical protein